MPVGHGGGRGRSRGGHGGNVTVAPERPRQKRKSEEQSSLYYHRRALNTGSTTTPSSSSAGGAGVSSSSTPHRHSPVSGSGGSGSGAGSRNHSNDEGGVRVVVRVRPLSAAEEAKRSERTMRCCNPKTLEFMSMPAVIAAGGAAGSGLNGDGGGGGATGGEGFRAYSFDLCAHEGFSQEEMFQSCGLMPLLSAAVNGYAGTVFAYGATGAGKTFTMSGREQIFRGDAGAGGRLRNSGGGGGSGDTTDGLIPRSMRYLFQRIAALPLGVTMRVRASFYEIYNEFVYDLLAQGDRRPLQVRYDVKRGFFVQGLFEVEIRGLNDIMAVVDEGNGNRRVSPHLVNKDSSRSHSLLTVYLHSEWKDTEDGHLVRTFGKVSFVDLAGSERLKKSKTLNDKETASINKSLMTLGKVISALSKRSAAAAASAHAPALAEQGAGGVVDATLSWTEDSVTNSNNSTAPADQSDLWIPYRDSTLTKLLMDSLGGNGLTLMVACVSPAMRHVDESAATLNYAARARNIRNRPLVRIDARERLIIALRREVNLLREENELLRTSKLAVPTDAAAAASSTKDGGTTAVLASGNDGSPEGWLEPFAPPLIRQGGTGAKGEAVVGVRSGAGALATATEASLMSQQQETAAFQIGQASRDVAVLLRKYEEECHRLRNEAALAQHKEMEVGKQTRQALMENDALSRTVERLQRNFATKETHPSRLASDDQDVEGRSTVQTALEAEKGADQQPLPLSSKAASLTFAATSDEEAASRPDENVRLEVTHLRRVNEALVERIESMERSQAQSMTDRRGGGRIGQNNTGGGRGGAGVVFSSTAQTAKTTSRIPPPKAAEPRVSTDSRTLRPPAAGSAKVQLPRRDPRGRLILHGDPGSSTSATATKRVPAAAPPPRRLVGGGNHPASPRGTGVAAREVGSSGRGGREAKHPRRSGGPGGAGRGRGGGFNRSTIAVSGAVVAATTVDAAAKVSSAPIVVKKGASNGKTVEYIKKEEKEQQQRRGKQPVANGSTTTPSKIPSTEAGGGVAIKKAHLPPETKTEGKQKYHGDEPRTSTTSVRIARAAAEGKAAAVQPLPFQEEARKPKNATQNGPAGAAAVASSDREGKKDSGQAGGGEAARSAPLPEKPKKTEVPVEKDRAAASATLAPPDRGGGREDSASLNRPGASTAIVDEKGKRSGGDASVRGVMGSGPERNVSKGEEEEVREANRPGASTAIVDEKGKRSGGGISVRGIIGSGPKRNVSKDEEEVRGAAATPPRQKNTSAEKASLAKKGLKRITKT